jgi:hypothetical protein
MIGLAQEIQRQHGGITPTMKDALQKLAVQSRGKPVITQQVVNLFFQEDFALDLNCRKFAVATEMIDISEYLHPSMRSKIDMKKVFRARVEQSLMTWTTPSEWQQNATSVIQVVAFPGGSKLDRIKRIKTVVKRIQQSVDPNDQDVLCEMLSCIIAQFNLDWPK